MNKKSTLKGMLFGFILSSLSFFSYGQILLQEGFESVTFPPTGWTTLDEDGNTTDNWAAFNFSALAEVPAGNYAGNFGAASRSYVASATTPDNWLITPQLNISMPNTTLTFQGLSNWGFTQGGTGDFLEVYVSTTGTATTDFSSVFSQNFTTEDWEAVSISLNAYTGQNIYIAFRHYNCTDQWYMALDDILISSPYTDLEVVSGLNNLNDYTMTPITQGSRLLTIATSVTNVGSLAVGSYVVNSNLYQSPDFTTPIQTFSTNGGVLAIGDTVTHNIGTYTASTLADYVVEHIVVLAADIISSNDTIYNEFSLTDYTFARDIGELDGPILGIDGGDEVILGTTYDITTNVNMDSVTFVVSPDSIGGMISVVVGNVSGGLPNQTFIGGSADILVDAALINFVDVNGFAVITVPVTLNNGNPIQLTAGNTYFVGVKQDSSCTGNMRLHASSENYTPNGYMANVNDGVFFDLTDQGFIGAPIMRAHVSVFTPITITSSDADNTVCAGQTVTLTSSSATGNVWSTGATTQSITVSTSGSYTVTVGGNTSAPTTVTVVSPATPTISTSGPTTFCNGGSVTLTSSVGGLGLLWSNGATTASINVTSTGNYSVTNTISGCSASSSVTAVTVLASPPTPTISASGATTFCSGGSVTLTSSAASGNTWSTGATTQAITVSSTGSYTVTHTVSGCSATSSITAVTVNATPSTPTITASGATTFCSGQSITLTSSAASGNTWSTGETTQAITVIASGSYSVTVTVSGCSATSAPMPVTVNTTPATPTISASGSTTFCSGNSVTLTSSSPTDNLWNTGATSQSITVSSAGNYGLTVTQNGCTAASSLTTISVNTSPVITTGTVINPIACGTTSGSVQVNGSGTGNVNWSGTASGVAPGNTLPYTITGLGSGSYAISFVDGNGCTSNTLTPSLSDPGAPAAPLISSSGSTSFCIGGSVILTSSSASGNTWSTGETTQSITVSTGGSYFVTNTVAGCSSTSTATTVVVNSLPTVNAGTYSAVCQNAADVVLNAGSPSGGTYSGTGVSGNNFDPSVGTQSILYTYTDGNGCSSSSTTTINTLALPTVNAGADQSICPGGSVTLSGSGAPSISWDQGVVNGVAFTPAVSGTYTLTGVDGNGCSNVDFVAVTIEALPVISIGTLTSPSSCGTATGSIEISGSGSGTINWTGTASGSQAVTLPATVSNLAAGTYTFNFSSAIGCPSNTLVQSLSDPGAPATPTISASGSTTFCSGGSVTLTSSSATNNTWSSGETTQSITVSTSGSYTVAVSVAGCSANSAATDVTVNSFPTIALGSVSNPSTCGTTTGSIQVSGSGTGNLSWSGTASGSLTGVSLPITISNLGAGSYTINFTDACPSNTLIGSLSDAGVVVPVISASGPTTFCAGGSVTLTSSVASGITWSNGATSQSITVSTAGTYSVTNAIGLCTAGSLPTVITINANPTVSAGSDQTVCSGTAVILSAVSTETVTWNNGVLDGVSFVPVATTSYMAVVTNGDGCSASDQVTVTVNAIPSVSTSGNNPTSCSGTDGSIVVNGTGAGSIVWFGTASGSANGITLPFTIGALTSGTYTVVFNSNNGCSSPQQIQTLSDPGAPTPATITASGATTFCAGGSVVLTSSETSGITWSTGETTPSITVSTSGNYNVSLNVGGCVSISASMAVTVTALPSITLGATNDPSTCASLTGSIEVLGSGSGDVSWSGTASGSQTGVSLPFTITGLGSGSYTITFDNGCTSSPITGSITDPGAPATPTISASGATTLCAGSTVVLTSSAGTGITWSTGETTASITVSTTGDYFATASAGACTSTSAIQSVVVNALPTVSAGSDVTVCAGETVTLSATASSSFAWDNGVVDGVAFTPSASGQYVVTATDINTCSATDTVDVTVNALPVITFDPVALLCVYHAAATMTALPAGGVFSGTGVSGSTFDPAGLTAGTYTVNYDVTENGCSATASQNIVVDSCLSVNNLSIEELTVYPNPTQGKVTIKGSQLSKFDYVAVKDQLGRTVIQQQGLSGEVYELNLNELANGTYVVVFTGQSEQQTYKIEVLK